LAVDEKRNPAEQREQHHDHRSAMPRDPGAKIFGALPRVGENGTHHREGGARQPDDSRRHRGLMLDRVSGVIAGKPLYAGTYQVILEAGNTGGIGTKRSQSQSTLLESLAR
jgi:hypothetical protein